MAKRKPKAYNPGRRQHEPAPRRPRKAPAKKPAKRRR
jgi:hypothetical protein